MLRVQFTVSRVLCVLFQRSIPLYSPVPVPLEPPNLPLSQIGIPYSSGSAVRVCYVCMYETNNNKTIYTIHIFFGFAFWKLKIRTKLGGHKRRRWKMFPVPSKITAVHYCPLPARGDPHPPPAMDLPRLTNPPHLRHPLFAEGGSTWISWSSNYLPDTNPLKKSGSQWTIEAQMFRQIVLLSAKYPTDPNYFISNTNCSNVGFVLMSAAVDIPQ